MTIEVIGIDHIYATVSSGEFYDRLMSILGFRKRAGAIGGDPHLHYYNRHFGYSLRPASNETPDHDPYAPGLHHFCFRVLDEAVVDRATDQLRAAGVEVTKPRYYAEYDADYYATFFEDPDGVRLEVTNFRDRRRRLMYDWDAATDL